MTFNVLELREIDALLGDFDHILWKLDWGPEDSRRRRCHEIQKRIKQLLADQGV